MKYKKHHKSEQVPEMLEHLDDPYGITWRVLNVFRSFHLPTLARFGAGLFRRIQFRRPILIVGMPRSGTTTLFHFLQTSPQLGSLGHEGHDAWRMFHHPRYSGWDSDHVGPGEVRPLERRFINSYFYAHFGEQRFVEKSANNCLRIPYLLDLFPDAAFVVMKRNPCNVINSIINGWRHPKGRFRAYYVPEDLNIPDYEPRRRWCFSLIEGWRDYTEAPIPEIALAQWRQYVQGVDDGRSLVPRDQWTEIYFEHFLDAPHDLAEGLCENLDLEMEPGMRNKLDTVIDTPVNPLTEPGEQKWRRENPEEVRSLLPRMVSGAETLGYTLDPNTGRCMPAPPERRRDFDLSARSTSPS